MDSRRVFVLLWMLESFTSTGIKLDGNGYVDITIAISSKVPQNNTLIDKIKDMVTEGSLYLHQALEKKVYFKDVTILVPSYWKGLNFTKAKTESFEKAKIRIDNADSTEPYTHQIGGCGLEGEYIHFTPNFLLDDNVIQPYGTRGRVLVHEWAHLRWGVFDEYSETKPFYHSQSNGRIEATRCSKSFEGQFYHLTPDRALQPCSNDPQTSLPTEGCMFFPNRNQNTNSSIMFLPSLDSVTTFCQENDHNYEAPNLQNEKCGKSTWSVIFEDSVDKNTLRSLGPLSSPPAPTFKVVQRMQRAVCLILDVSGSMTTDSRILRLQQAATHLLRNIIEDQASVGIVSFSSDAETLSNLTVIDESTRENLIKLLPNVPDGWTYMCKGLNLGLQVLKTDNGDALGDEIIFLTDGEATDNINDCRLNAINSGAIIHTLALGPKADKALEEMAERTGGKFIFSNDNITSNQLMDAFGSLTLSTGDYTQEPVQLESVGTTTSDWFNGTVSVDQTVGEKTSFVIIYEKVFPSISIQSPNGSIYTETQMSHDALLKTVTLKVPGTAEPGDWKYSMKSPTLQSLTITVTSQAARADVPPITVKTHINQQFSDGTKPMIVFAEVSQNYKPVINAEVWAILESGSGSAQTLQLLDNGAGADVFRNDGIYSRYLTKLEKGRSSLKVRVKNKKGQARVALQKKSGAYYVPGYVVNGMMELNPPKPSVSKEPLEVDSFTRTVTGESFEVAFTGSTPNFPPNRITDLSAEIQEDSVLLNWTAPGDDLDQGKAKSYEIRWSFDHHVLHLNFNLAHVVNTTAVSPQEAGSAEQHSFNLNIIIQNGTTLFFAIQSEDEQNAKSEISNIAQVSKILPDPKSYVIPNAGLNLPVLVISLCLVTLVICFVAITIWAMKHRKYLSYSLN